MNGDLKLEIRSDQNSDQNSDQKSLFIHVADSRLGCRVFDCHSPRSGNQASYECNENVKITHAEPHAMRPTAAYPK